MKKKSLSILIAVALASTTILPAASVFADTTTTPVTVTAPTPVTSAPASTYGVEYEGQVQNIGWQTPVTTTGDASAITTAPIAGTVNKGLRVEALKVTGTNLPAGASITYQGQVQNVGWQTPVTTTGNADIATAAIAGTVNKGLRVEGFKMTLNGLPGYAIEYQTQIQNIGWQAAVQTTNGADISTAALSGTQNKGLRLEALRVELVKTTAEKTSEVSAINAVQTAESSGLAADVTAATAAITLVQDTVENAALTARVAAINITVASVKAASASSFAVTLSGAPADQSKLTFTVLNGTTPVTVTPTWSADGKTATLTSTATLPESTYTVDVKNGTTDLGTTSVAITEQKIASITLTSTKLAVVGTYGATTGTTQTGYASYTVLDQYGVDITKSALANDINWQSGVCAAGDITGKNGQLKLIPNVNLITFPTVVVTGYDSTTGVSASATLTTSTAIGTLSDFQVGTALTNADGKKLTAGDTTDVFYLPYTATDISGNPTSNYDLITAGLITSKINGNENCLTSSDSDVTAQVVKDPNDSDNAVIQVTVDSTDISADIPFVINSITYTGKSSSISLTLAREAELYSFKLQSPAEEVAIGDDDATIPFTAVDQEGNAITSYSTLIGDQESGKLTLSTGLSLSANSDGSASLKYAGPFTSTGNQMLTANTSQGQYSTLNVDIQKQWVADSLTLDSTILVNSMQTGATQKIDFGYDKGGLTALDQYGRTIDMTSAPGNYEVTATSSNTNAVTVSGIAEGGSDIVVTGVATGSSTVTLSLVNKVTGTVIDTKSEIISDVEGTKVTGYTIDTVPSPIYVGKLTAADGSSTQQTGTDYSANPVVYGTTSSGAKVALGTTTKSSITGLTSNTILSASVNSSNFAIAGYADPSDIYVNATGTTNSATTASTTLSVTVMGSDGLVHALSTPITSSTDAPAAQSVIVKVANETPGISINSAGDTVTVDLSNTDLAADGLTANSYLTHFNPDGTPTKKVIYLAPLDQYGEKDGNLSSITQTSVSAAGAFSVDGTGKISGTPAAGQSVTLTGSANGHTKTLKIVFTGTAKTATTALAAIIAGTENISDFATVGITGAVSGNKTAYDTAIAVAAPTTSAAIQTIVINVNATASLAAITAGTESFADFATAGVTGALSGNKTAYDTAIAADVTAGTAITVPVINGIVTSVNAGTATSSSAAALTALNAATTTATMETAIQDTDLGLTLTVYNELNTYNKSLVAQELLAAQPTAGYATELAVQTALDATTEITTQAAKDTLNASIALVATTESGKTEGSVVGNTVVGSKTTLDAASTAASAVASTSTAAQFTAANTTLQAAITAYKAAVVKSVGTLVAPGVSVTTGTSLSITGATALTGSEVYNVVSATPAVATVSGLSVTPVSAGTSVITVQILDGIGGNVIATGTVTVTVGI